MTSEIAWNTGRLGRTCVTHGYIQYIMWGAEGSSGGRENKTVLLFTQDKSDLIAIFFREFSLVLLSDVNLAVALTEKNTIRPAEIETCDTGPVDMQP